MPEKACTEQVAQVFLIYEERQTDDISFRPGGLLKPAHFHNFPGFRRIQIAERWQQRLSGHHFLLAIFLNLLTSMISRETQSTFNEHLGQNSKAAADSAGEF